MTKTVITSDKAPAAIGTYSHIKAGNTVYMSGQIPLGTRKPWNWSKASKPQTTQVFENLKAVAEAAGGSFKDIVKN